MTPPGILFTATWHGSGAAIGRATEAELAPLVRQGVPGVVRDVLRPSFLVAVRRADVPEAAVHALGWRQRLLNTWITSRLVAIDFATGTAATRSRNVYRLAGADGHDELPTLLHDHLWYALRTWGFDDVVAS